MEEIETVLLYCNWCTLESSPLLSRIYGMFGLARNPSHVQKGKLNADTSAVGNSTHSNYFPACHAACGTGKARKKLRDVIQSRYT